MFELLKRFVVNPIGYLLMKIILFTFSDLPIIYLYIKTFGKFNEKYLKQRKIRAKRVNESDPSSPYRTIESLDKLKVDLEDGIETVADIPEICAKRYGDRQTMGHRKILDVQDELQDNGTTFKKFTLGEYEYLTYNQINDRINRIGRALLALGARPHDKVAIYSETRAEWLLTAFAAFKYRITIVTLYSTLGEDAIKQAINQSEVSMIITSEDLILKVQNILDSISKVRHVIYFTGSKPSFNPHLSSKQSNVQFHHLNQLEQEAFSHQIDDHIINQRAVKQDLAVIMYTSGSTGLPKGVMISHGNILAALTGQYERVKSRVDADQSLNIAYLPLAHILELSAEIMLFYMGVKIGYSSPQTLTDQSTGIRKGEKGDLQVLRPTWMSCVPAVLDRIEQTVMEKVNEAPFLRRCLFNLFFKIKVRRLEKGLESPFLDKILFSRFNQMVLGGRLKTMLCGGALLNEDTQRFIQAVLCVPIFQAYALSETAVGGTVQDEYDRTVGRVGIPIVSTEIRLLNWDEANYKNTDKPNPRGEILIGGETIALGYYLDTSDESFNFKTIDGTKYFATGDIGEIFPDGTLKIIVKLRNGEYICLTKIEMIINKLPFIFNSCLYAKPSAAYPILLISPNIKQIQSYAEKHFHEKNWKKLLDNENFNEKILKDVQLICKKNRLQRFEIPQKVQVVNEVWTPDTGFVTDALKLKRKTIQTFYNDLIDNLYLSTQKQKTS